MTRTITDHQVNPANDKLTITVLDEPADGGANHVYEISGHDEEGHPFFAGKDDPRWQNQRLVVFQQGPIGEVGVNGVTHEALLAVLIDRMRAFQAGPYACTENDAALRALEDAQYWLLSRTRARMARGVEGTHQK